MQQNKAFLTQNFMDEDNFPGGSSVGGQFLGGQINDRKISKLLRQVVHICFNDINHTHKKSN